MVPNESSSFLQIERQQDEQDEESQLVDLFDQYLKIRSGPSKSYTEKLNTIGRYQFLRPYLIQEKQNCVIDHETLKQELAHLCYIKAHLELSDRSQTKDRAAK